MKISLNWLKQYIDLENTPDEISTILTSLGLEVEGMETIESIRGGLEGIVVGEIVERHQHPNADRLSLTKVNIGTGELLSIVCGAPNVAQGQKVMVAVVGTTLYDKEGKAMKMQRSKIRGEVSEGMICAEDELGLGNDHSGIMVLPAETPVGTLAKTYYNISNDTVFEIGLTPNRSDATCHLGVAEDLAAYLNTNGYPNLSVKKPIITDFSVKNTSLSIPVTVENAEACPRYAGVCIKGVSIKESPQWLKDRLTAIGVRPISNVVDITNYILHTYGQPLHAFDLDRIKGGKIVVKTLPAGSKFLALDGLERKLSDQDLMICDAEGNGMCIGGVFGGLTSGISDTTKAVFLEAAHFNGKWIRRSSTRHQLFTDAAKTFEKGTDPNVCTDALKAAALLIQELAGGEVASEIVDIYPKKVEKAHVKVAYSHINKLIGTTINKPKVKEILAALRMDIITETNTNFTVAIPTNKVDVTREADVIEEILRVYGLDNVPLPQKLNTALSFSARPNPHSIKNTVSDYLTSNGCHEIMATSLSQSRYYKEILPIDDNELVYVNNTSNAQLDILRPSMIFSGLEAILHNQNRQHPDLKLYEWGKTYRKNDAKYTERQQLSIFFIGQNDGESWLNPYKKSVSYYHLKAHVENIAKKLGVSLPTAEPLNNEAFAFGETYKKGKNVLVEMGQLQASITKKMDIKQPVLFANFYWDEVLNIAKKNKIVFSELNKYPTVRRDLALVLDNSVKFAQIEEIAQKTAKKLLKNINLFDVYENEAQLGKNKKSYAVSFLFEDNTKTLTDRDIDSTMQALVKMYEDKLQAVIRK
jgi:phenylalanyl-tRNA synthetase beta chain